MFKKQSSIIITVIVVLIMTSTVWAAQNGNVTISLDEAIKTAIENDQQLKLTDEKIKLAQRRYNSAVAIAKDAPDKYWSTDAQHVANKNEELLYPLQRETELNELKWQRKNLERKLRIEITKLYYQILQKQQSLNNQKSAISRTKAEYDSMKKKVEAGILTDSTLLSYELAMNEADLALKKIQTDLDDFNINFNDRLGVSLDTVVILKKTDLPTESVSVTSIDELAAEVVAASHDIKKLEANKLIDKTKYDILRQYYYNTPDECETLEDKLLNYDYDIRDKKVAVELKIRQDYNNLLNLKDDITIKELDYNQKLKLMEIEKKKSDLGLSTSLDYIRAVGNRDDAFFSLNSARLSYFIAILDFKSYIEPLIID